MTEDAEARQTAAEVAHWLLAAQGLADLDDAAAPEAWAGLETYLQRGLRDRMAAMVAALVAEARAVQRLTANGAEPAAERAGVLRLRRRYLQAEVVLDFYGDAINSRSNPALRGILRGLDTLAGDSMAVTLGPLGIDAPPALVYVDKGLGASILRAGIRLWDHAHPSPAAAIKLTRHNLSHPTALLHETGHQVAHLTGWTAELADALYGVLAPRSVDVAQLWRSWAGEVAADVHAFALAGWAPVFALSTVVDGTTAEVFRIRYGDPHPFGWIRVMFNAALCRSWYGAGPWDDVANAWRQRHPMGAADAEAREVARVSVDALADLVDVCTRRPLRAFRGAPLSAVMDPRAVSPDRLRELERQAGGTLLTSSYLRRRHSLPLFALLSTRAVLDPANATAHHTRLRDWLRDVGADAVPHAA
ncbi:hypothetical protein GCM10027451_49850 [Geodermatophilus aquaeductus]|uniref:Uncharacterized protein n=1 Tax=Geodermatophilus aquaeductus TaxID=1564161 RepID=A0A521BZ11_9ACTN|nr:hypothetical protein [Geodermatophilus aquaeductus]SMO52432.1 hypothetical protein SAMN06273567_1028 [Geodermatophilus aquaeductus]